MTIEQAITVLRGMEKYLCSGNPIWRTELIKESVNMACEALVQAGTPQAKLHIDKPRGYTIKSISDTPQTRLFEESSDCDLWQKDRTCIGCYRYEICKDAERSE